MTKWKLLLPDAETSKVATWNWCHDLKIAHKQKVKSRQGNNVATSN